MLRARGHAQIQNTIKAEISDLRTPAMIAYFSVMFEFALSQVCVLFQLEFWCQYSLSRSRQFPGAGRSTANTQYGARFYTLRQK